MKLVIGGYAQGKQSYVMQHFAVRKEAVVDMADTADVTDTDGMADATERMKGTEAVTDRETFPVFDHFHLWFREELAKGNYPEKQMEQLLEHFPDCIIISDEVGNGIVPVDAFEREYRDRLGRMLILLAQKADEVVRVICGIGQKIK